MRPSSPSEGDDIVGSRRAAEAGKAQQLRPQLLRDLLRFAVRDKIIGDNPAEHLKYFKREKPIRPTPTKPMFMIFK